mgnify:CR=1 FL=1
MNSYGGLIMNNNEILLLKLGEVVLKGLNRRSFEDKLVNNVRRRMKPCGSFQVYIRQSTIYVEPQPKTCSVTTAPPTIEGMDMPTTVTTGVRAFFRACFMITFHFPRPLDLAVRM